MKYSVEFNNGKFVETLEVDGHIATKTWSRENEGSIVGLCSHDNDFSEQLAELLDEEQCDYVHDTFDFNMIVSDIEDFIVYTGVE